MRNVHFSLTKMEKWQLAELQTVAEDPANPTKSVDQDQTASVVVSGAWVLRTLECARLICVCVCVVVGRVLLLLLLFHWSLLNSFSLFLFVTLALFAGAFLFFPVFPSRLHLPSTFSPLPIPVCCISVDCFLLSLFAVVSFFPVPSSWVSHVFPLSVFHVVRFLWSRRFILLFVPSPCCFCE